MKYLRAVILFIMWVSLSLCENHPPKIVKSIDSEYLLKRTYYLGTIPSSTRLRFFRSYEYEIEFTSEGMYWFDRGHFAMQNGIVHLNPERCASGPSGPNILCADSMGDATCVLQEKTDSVYFRNFLTCKSLKNRNVDGEGNDSLVFSEFESKLPSGTRRKVGNNKVVTLGARKGKTTGNAIIYEEPSTSSRALPYSVSLFADEQSFVPKGMDTILIARTELRSSAYDSSDYWYYVQIGSHSGVWMFGRFLTCENTSCSTVIGDEGSNE